MSHCWPWLVSCIMMLYWCSYLLIFYWLCVQNLNGHSPFVRPVDSMNHDVIGMLRFVTCSSSSKVATDSQWIFGASCVCRFYKGLIPLWARQIPYTMMKFACFERTVEALYKFVVPRPRAECTKSEQLVVTFAAGYIGEAQTGPLFHSMAPL